MGKSAPPQPEVFTVRTFYQFQKIPASRLLPLQKLLLQAGEQHSILGSILLAEEGCNATISGAAQQVESFFQVVEQEFPGIPFQDSLSESRPFQHWKVPIKKQIVAALHPERTPETNFEGQITPRQWDDIRAQVRNGEAQMIDVRNRYETRLGSFPEAIDPGTTTFKEFSRYLDREVGRTLDPDKPTAIFCTGGIRCEKARVDLEQRGFTQVLQLKGGIIGYLSSPREAGFEGECFVFDDRVALDAELRPTQKYTICKACGGPTPINGGQHDCNDGRRTPE